MSALDTLATVLTSYQYAKKLIEEQDQHVASLKTKAEVRDFMTSDSYAATLSNYGKQRDRLFDACANAVNNAKAKKAIVELKRAPTPQREQAELKVYQLACKLLAE